MSEEIEKPKTLFGKIVEMLIGFVFIVGLCFVGYKYYTKQETKTIEPSSQHVSEIDFYKNQSIAIQKHIAMNDTILFHLISENKMLRNQYDSVLQSAKSAPKQLPIFK